MADKKCPDCGGWLPVLKSKYAVPGPTGMFEPHYGPDGKVCKPSPKKAADSRRARLHCALDSLLDGA